jgi:hypothetical protein
MRERARNQVRRNEPNPFATREDFFQVFHADMNGLYQLSFLLTGDHEKAERCFVAGIWAYFIKAPRILLQQAYRMLGNRADARTPFRTLSLPIALGSVQGEISDVHLGNRHCA